MATRPQNWEAIKALFEAALQEDSARRSVFLRERCADPSLRAGDLTTGVKGSVPNDFVYIVGADAWINKWPTGDFDIVGQRVFGTETLAVTHKQFLVNCGTCAANPSPDTVTLPNLASSRNQSYNIANASMGIKVRPFASLSRLVFTANVLVRLDDGGLRSKAAPQFGVGYTF
jgi:hypothetical protein